MIVISSPLRQRAFSPSTEECRHNFGSQWFRRIDLTRDKYDDDIMLLTAARLGMGLSSSFTMLLRFPSKRSPAFLRNLDDLGSIHSPHEDLHGGPDPMTSRCHRANNDFPLRLYPKNPLQSVAGNDNRVSTPICYHDLCRNTLAPEFHGFQEGLI